jgi:excinuclease UvrABC nuclease subunit
MIELAISDDTSLDAIPDRPAVFLLWPRAGKPYLARTNVLRKRLARTLKNLGGSVERLEYRLTGSKLEAQFLVWELARTHLGASYRDAIRLRMPSYVKLILSNRFPRTVTTAKIGRAPAVYFGPFRNRASAARFESGFLDLFQLRRCQEDLEPGLSHPGCIYGEMGRCLRPCQRAVGVEEYAGETERVAAFLRTGGRSLLSVTESARERMTNELDFEGAAVMHQRVQRIAEVIGLRDEMAAELNHLNAIVVVPSTEPDAVELGWLRQGIWQGFSRIAFAAADARAVSLDARLRDLALAVPRQAAGPVERMEQLAILARWFYATWRDGELLLFDDWEKPPIRKLVNAVSRTAHGQQPNRPNIHS